MYISIDYYFNNPSIINTDINNGYQQYKYKNLNYLVKGESQGKGYILYQDLDIYLLNSSGILETTINLNNLAIQLGLEDYIISTCGQLDYNTYWTILEQDGTNMRLVIFNYDLVHKLFTNIYCYDTINTNGQHMTDHGFYIINAQHVYINSPNIIQEIVCTNTNKVIWECDIDHLVKQASPYLLNSKNQIYCHINAIAELDKQHLLISDRNLGIYCLNKLTKNIEWFIANKKNDFNFKNLPLRQHGLSFIDSKHTKFCTFSNNWNTNTEHTINIISQSKISELDYQSLKNSSIIIYNLETNQSWEWTSKILATPRFGNVEFNSDFFTINYGWVLTKYETKIYTLGLLEEHNLLTKNNNFSLKLADPKFRISSRL